MKGKIVCMTAAVSLITVLICGCSLRPIATQDQPILPETGKASIAAMPFLRGLHDSSVDKPIDGTLDCALVDLCFDIRHIRSDAEKTLTRYLQEALEQRLGERMIRFEKTLTAYNGLATDQKVDTPRSLAVRLGRELKANHVIMGTVWRYRERTGTARASSSPASVGFVVYVINVADGKRLWKKTYIETQKPLSESILDARTFFRRGVRWLTIDELARYAVYELVKQLPYGT